MGIDSRLERQPSESRGVGVSAASLRVQSQSGNRPIALVDVAIGRTAVASSLAILHDAGQGVSVLRDWPSSRNASRVASTGEARLLPASDAKGRTLLGDCLRLDR